MSAEDFGERLRGVILARHPSLGAFADAIEMERPYLSRIVNGHVREPSRETMRRMAAALDMDLSELERLTGLRERGSAVEAAEAPALADVLAILEADPEVGPQLAEIKRTQTDRVYRQAVAALAEAWRSNAKMMLRTFEVARQARDEGRD